MDQIFAPWRIEWVERDGESDADGGDACPFCALPDADDDRENRVVARSDHSFVLLNNYPYNPGHVMVIPYRHSGSWSDLSDEELLDHARLKARTVDALNDALGPDAANAGENLGGGASGGSIEDHLHTHIVPRWNGDTNFMPVIGDTKVIVEALDDTFDRLHEAFAAQEGASVDGSNDAVELDFEFPSDS
ncbi:hit family hydrolase, diadenosine tetraphosphate hydrolase [Halogeometricum borinquense DSM 11551]|uniref:HIT family hydrolase, Diadenosine tetraphosphate hydrolase n=2 Tax=Halogeometricum borinquense TaxID=60847 RepID=E4NPT6_HALBP|nr:HIT domain-containing protein [Halogeometricum borinquense]ADQ66569.1 HIT family hydrolase, diadenosine tetraphosphate hydrolase [Halogeometricum borinquense DSM 11551]ELY30677.1 hit family hydrolase, diadenosine tetraphosphate hydrolase [Halogeometricum borinquense DSM 11551]RYJ14427.1 HIT domain-containing protein [Halogeometricum borinquense]